MIDTTGKGLVEHWKWAAERGLMNSNTASSFRAACSQILAVEEGWEDLDIRTITVDDFIRRFQNKRAKDFTPTSLQVYGSRFRQAVALFLQYLENPGSWKVIPRRLSKKEAKKNHVIEEEARDVRPFENHQLSISEISVRLVEYPFPLRNDLLVKLQLPADLKKGEVKRIHDFLLALAQSDENDV